MDVNRRKKKKSKRYSESFKREVIEYYLSHRCSKQHVWNKFVDDREEKGSILKWMRQLDYVGLKRKKTKWSRTMDEEDSLKDDAAKQSDREKKLKSELKEARLEIIAYKKMIAQIEKEYKIPFSKKSDTKS